MLLVIIIVISIVLFLSFLSGACHGEPVYSVPVAIILFIWVFILTT